MSEEFRKRLEILAEQGDSEAQELLNRHLKREGLSLSRFARCKSTQAGLQGFLVAAIGEGKWPNLTSEDWKWHECLPDHRLWLLARGFTYHVDAIDREFWLHRPCRIGVQQTEGGWLAMATSYRTRDDFDSPWEALAHMHRTLKQAPFRALFVEDSQG